MKQNKTKPEHVGKAPYHLLLLFVVLCVAFFAHSYALNLDLNIASRGFSVLEVLQALGNPAGFERDFAGGARLTTAASPTVYIYFLGYHLGVNWMAMIYAMIVLEMCTLLLGARLLWASFLGAGDNWSSEQKRLLNIMFVWVAAFLLISSVQRVNIANFGFPFFHGQFYGFADGLRLAVLALVLRRRWILGAVLFVACFAIHPIKAVIMAGFAVPIVVYDWRSIWNFRFVLAALIAGIGALIWSTLILGNNATGVGVPLADFVAYTRTLQFHWYPFDTGLFGKNHLQGASPFMALLLVVLLALAQEGWDPQLKRKLLLGLGATLGLTAFGLYVSAVPTSATLIRISFVRASNLVTLIAPIIIVAGIFFAWRNHDRVLASGFFAFLCTGFSPSVEKTTLSAGFALVLFVIHARRGKTSPLLVTTALLVGGSLAWFAVKHTGFESAIVGVLPATLILLLLLLMFKAIDRFNPAGSYGYGAAVVFTLCVFVGGLIYGVERTKMGHQ